MPPMKRVLIIGLVPSLVDFSSMPDLDADKVMAGLQAQEQALTDLGFAPVQCLVDLGETAEAVARQALEAGTYDVVVIGAGVRAVPAHFLLFEKLINLVHALAPTAKIAFNTRPTDTTDAVLRWTEGIAQR